MEWLLVIVAIFVIFAILSFFYRRSREEYDSFVLQNGGLLFLTRDEFKLYWDHNVALKSKSSNYVRMYCVYSVEYIVNDDVGGKMQHTRYVRAPKAFNELTITQKFLYIKMAYRDEFDARIKVTDITFDSLC